MIKSILAGVLIGTIVFFIPKFLLAIMLIFFLVKMSRVRRFRRQMMFHQMASMEIADEGQAALPYRPKFYKKSVEIN